MKIVGSFVKYGRFVYRIELFSYGNRTLLSVFIIASWMGALRAKAGQTGASKGAEVDDACLSDVDLVSRRGSVVSLLGWLADEQPSFNAFPRGNRRSQWQVDRAFSNDVNVRL